MDFQRFFLVLIFSFSAFLLWDGWQRYQQPTPPVQSAIKHEITTETGLANIAKSSPEIQNTNLSRQTNLQGKKIVVRTDNLLVEINTAGGDIQRVELLRHHDSEDKNKPFILLNQEGGNTYIAQTGLLGQGLPTHQALFFTNADEYHLADGTDTVSVKLNTADNTVSKILTFHRGSYLIDVTYEIENLNATPLTASAYFQLVRDESIPVGASKLVPTYTGPAIYTDQEKFQKIEFSAIEKNKTSYPKTAESGWVAMLQHYFVSAWLPKGKTTREYYTKALENKLFSIGAIVPVNTIAPGQKGSVSASLYVGPASAKLDDIAPGLGLTVDYGWLTIIATPLFWLLTFIQGWIHNWGAAIIVLTILIKLAFFPLSAASYRSMAKMRIVAPKLEKIKQQYSNNREKLNQAMMDLYKTEKINPLGGCLPMLIQIPVFISLYWAILSSVELRHAPFIGWINDLSAADPYYVLPAIMGISMLIQGKLNPTPPDPLQAKLMQFMPVIFSVVFFFFPAGLVLYSVVNNILSIAQQWYITRAQETELKVAV